MKRNKFSLSHYKPMTMKMGYLYPICWVETLPGDTFQMSTSAFIRMLELNTPVLHPIRARINHWWVPMSQIWDEDDMHDFFTGGEDGDQAPTHPYKGIGSVTAGYLTDYLGLPVGTWGGTINVSALPFRAYYHIWNTKFRDQQLQTAEAIGTNSGSDTTTAQNTVKRVCWEKDYFTTCRPDENLGTDPTIPLTGTVDIDPDAASVSPEWKDSGAGTGFTGSADGATADYQLSAVPASGALYWDDPHLEVDLSAAAANISLSDMYVAQAAERFQQLRNVYGARYHEYLRQAFGVKRYTRPDEPIFLGGGRATLQVDAAIATDSSNTGDLYGVGTGAIRTRRFRRFFDEHGILMSTVSIVPKAVYTESINRKWLRTAKEEYFTKEYQLVGEQIVTNKEAQAMHTSPDGTFGYQERYGEYKTHPSEVSGDFNGSLNTWHLGREYSGDIALNESWLQCNPSNRIFKSTSTDNLIALFNNSIQARRQMLKNVTGKTF